MEAERGGEIMSGVRNTLGDLHNMLMEQMEKLNEAGPDELDGEIKCSKAMSGLAAQINGNARTILQAESLAADTGVKPSRMLTDGSDDEA